MNQHPKEVFKEHHHEHCLNCGQVIHENFCSRCGQNTHTHRLSIWHFLVHDFVHSIWHVDHGIILTLEEVLIRPGKAAMEYIRGKRVGRFPILTLLLILLGIFFGLAGDIHVPEKLIDFSGNADGKKFLTEFFYYLTHYRKWLVLTTLPSAALGTWLVFRRIRLNYTEHLLINGYAFAGMLVVTIYVQLFGLCFPNLEDIFGEIGFFTCVAIFVLAYAQAFHSYSLLGLIWRFFLLALLDFFIFVINLIVVLVIISMLVLGKEGKLFD